MPPSLPPVLAALAGVALLVLALQARTRHRRRSGPAADLDGIEDDDLAG